MKNKTRYRHYRILAELSQSDVAKHIGCTSSAYSKYEKGDREPSVDTLIKLADLYEISVDELIGHKISCEKHCVEDYDTAFKYDSLAKLKKTFDIELATKIGDSFVLNKVNTLIPFMDCISVKDSYRQIDFLLLFVKCDIKSLVKIFGVSRSGYYHWKEYGDVVRARNQIIADEILKYEFLAINSAGYKAVTSYLRTMPNKPEYKNISVARVKRIMDEFEIIPEDLRAEKNRIIKKVTSEYRASDLPVKENLIKRNFSFDIKPCTIWCIDITEVKIAEGKVYICAVMDLCGRYIVGHSIGDSMNAFLVKRAVRNAKKNAEKYCKRLENTIIIHSDRGLQFRSQNTQKYFKDENLKSSMSRPYNSNDNACIESFFASLKCEYLYQFKINTYDEVKALVDRYILYYNTLRVHQTIMDMPYSYWLRQIEK